MVGYFYEMYRSAVIERVAGIPPRDILEIGCGEGHMFEGTGITPVQMDVSMRRLTHAVARGRWSWSSPTTSR